MALTRVRPGNRNGRLFSHREWDELAISLSLSPQQVRIIQCLLDGLEDKEIAGALQSQSSSASRSGKIKTTTVREHINRMFDKLGLKNRKRTALVAAVFREFRKGCFGKGCPRA